MGQNREVKQRMTLTKGFLRSSPILNKQIVPVGLLIWPLFSFGLYGVCYFLREAIRLIAGNLGLGSLIVLSPAGYFWYNLFYASLAVIIGFYFFIKFVFEDSVDFSNHKIKRRQRHILNEQGFTSWSFLYAFGQISMVLGILFITMPLQFDIDFLEDYPHLLILIPVVLYLNSWPLILRSMGRAAFKWMGYSFLLVSLLSVGFANINLSDYQKIDQALLARNVQSAYDLRLPAGKSHERINNYPILDFYIVHDALSPNEPVIFLDDTRTRLSLEEMEGFLKSERNSFGYFSNTRPTVNLHIDERIRVSFVNRFKQALRIAGIENIHYSTGVKHSKYPSHYPPFKYSGIPELLFPYYPEFVALLDSAEKLDLRKYTVKVPESDYYRIREVGRYKRMKVKVTPEQVFLNNRAISAEALQAYTAKFMRKYAPDYMVIYEPDTQISYKRYIECKDLILSANNNLRHEMSYELYNQPFDYWYRDREYLRIREMYPRNVLEWTEEEKRLLELLNRRRRLRESL